MMGELLHRLLIAWKLIWTLAVRELVSMFRVPAGWIIIALFAFLSAVLFVSLAFFSRLKFGLRMMSF